MVVCVCNPSYRKAEVGDRIPPGASGPASLVSKHKEHSCRGGAPRLTSDLNMHEGKQLISQTIKNNGLDLDFGQES